MDLETALKGMLDAENSLRSKEGVNNPVFMSENMMRLSQYAGAVEEHLAQCEKDFETQYAHELKIRIFREGVKITQAEREIDIKLAELKGQIKYLTRLVASAWKQTNIIQSRIQHLIKESQSTNLWAAQKLSCSVRFLPIRPAGGNSKKPMPRLLSLNAWNLPKPHVKWKARLSIMSGNPEGALKGVATKLNEYGPDHYKKIGALGGAKSKGRKLSAKTKRKISQAKKRKKNV